MGKLPLLLLLLGAGASLSAQAPSGGYSVHANFTYAGKYVLRGRQLAADSFQPAVQITSASAYGSVWVNQPFHGKAGREVDLNGGGQFALGGVWNLDAGATLYHYPDTSALHDGRDNTLEGYLGLNGSVGGTVLGFYAFRDLTLDATTLQGTAAYSVPWNEWATLRLAAAVGESTPDHGASYAYASVGATLSARISDKATFTFGANGSATRHLTGGDRSQLWLTTGLSVAF